MLTGKFWIRADGVPVSVTEHAEYGKRFLLKMPDDESMAFDTIFVPPTEEQVKLALSRGADLKDLRALQSNGDCREYLISQGWVRIRGDHYYVWELDKATVRRIAGATDYWRWQSKLEKGQVAKIITLKDASRETGCKEHDVPVSDLRLRWE